MSDIVYLSYMPERKAFGVKEDKIEKLRNEGKSPKIKIAPKDWKKINPKYAADKSNPMVAFLLGREDGYYLMMENYVKALAFVSVNLKILTHEDPVSELDDVCGLILPGRLDDPLNTFANPNLPKKPVPPVRKIRLPFNVSTRSRLGMIAYLSKLIRSSSMTRGLFFTWVQTAPRYSPIRPMKKS